MYCFQSCMKKRLNVTVDEDSYIFVKKLGINISSFLNERIKELKEKCEDK